MHLPALILPKWALLTTTTYLSPVAWRWAPWSDDDDDDDGDDDDGDDDNDDEEEEEEEEEDPAGWMLQDALKNSFRQYSSNPECLDDEAGFQI